MYNLRTMLVERVAETPKAVKVALSICPDLRLTSLGPYTESVWRDFADGYLLHQQEIEKGLSIENYQHWLDWSYEMLANGDRDNPVTQKLRNLRELEPNIQVLWAMSFHDKGFTFIDRYDGNSIKFRKILYSQADTSRSFNIERELVEDRFGELAMVERYYQLERPDNLIEISTCVKDPESKFLIARIDD